MSIYQLILQILQRAASTNNPVRSIPQIVEEASSTFSDEVAEESVRTLVARMAADPDVDVERVARGLYRITDAGDADGDETEEVTLVATELKKLIEQAEAEGGRIDTVLEAQQATLELILQSEFKRMLRRRTMYLLLMVAVSLVVGILINLLFVMTKGGSIFSTL